MTAASVTPAALAAKSSQSPLLRPPVQFACNISISPLISTGASHAQRKRLLGDTFLWHLKYSIHIAVHVPAYMAM